ncbi:hypothetical protein DPMN_136060 [Dreissena polymorpha]|uniref:Uncharacterized protein n=1 Tax=Dreissena polymorpha TaxID=45954 RepID=A0A9D4FZA2_DREPO|nr:hypothetical protein DPMN_136060 [Dreissena polymorpha]
MQSWFSDPVSKTANHISCVLKEEQLKDVGLIVLVGGFAESPCVKQRTQKSVPKIQPIFHGEVCLAVLNGAVMFGHKSDIILSRFIN